MNCDPIEIAWFAALCDDDYEYLGVPDPTLRSSWEHCRDIVLAAERLGYDNVLLPSGYELGIDATAFAAAVATQTERIKLLLAVRCGELWPPQLARQLATVDRIANGRLTLNVISSDIPGAPVESGRRYQRTREVMQILRQALDGDAPTCHGEFFDFDLNAPNATTQNGRCPSLYFGGLSEDARECASAEADVFLMWPDTLEALTEIMADMRRRAAAKRRTIRFGYRVHVIVRETEAEARAAAAALVSRLDAEVGEQVRSRSLDSQSIGVRRQAELRDAAADDGFVEANLWTGIGRARSGCGAAIVGDSDQVATKIRAYQDLGIDSFILSGYPHLEECERFARLVMPLLHRDPDRA